MLLKEILDDKLFNTPLLVKGYSNFKIFKDKKEFLLKVGLENKETKEIFATDNLQPEFLSLFPLRSVIHKGKIEKFEGSVKEILLNFDKVKYKKFKDIDNSDLKDLINKLFYFNNETYFAKYKNIVIPSLIIGQYFYFPNTNVRRLFRKEHIDALAYEVNCNSGHIIFKRNVKNEDITAIFAYLFECNEYFAESFSNAFSINIDYPLKENLELYSPTLFKFPQIDKELKLVVRGEKFNNVFIVYEILNFDFRQIIHLDKLEISYLGRKTLKNKFLKTTTVASKIPTNTKNISQLESYSKEFEETIFESSEFLINRENQIKVEKIEPKKFDISNSQKKIIKEKKENEGITFGNNQDNTSWFASAGIGISKSDIYLLKDFIEKGLNVSIYEVSNLKDYSYIYFVLIFKDGSFREYLIVKLNRQNSATYILSSAPGHLKHFKSIAKELLDIFDKKHKYFKNFNHYSRYLKNKYDICFHTSLKKGKKESVNDWLKRLKEKIENYTECKGINIK